MHNVDQTQILLGLLVRKGQRKVIEEGRDALGLRRPLPAGAELERLRRSMGCLLCSPKGKRRDDPCLLLWLRNSCDPALSPPVCRLRQSWPQVMPVVCPHRRTSDALQRAPD